MAEERLQKILANAGIASRRKAEELIVSGHVSVNGVTVTELGSKADLAVDEVKCDGQRLKAPKNYVYFAFNKPKNVMTTVNDPERRETVMHFFKGLKERIYPVGRLDYASEGLLLLTNDGEFANLISSPTAHVPKTYLVKVNGILTADQQETFRRGIPMHGKRTAPAKLKVVRSTVNPWYEVTLAEGRQNQIRIMFKHFGFLVEKLRRIRIGFLDLGGLKGGAYRTLTREEVERFRRMLKMDGGEGGKPAGTEARADKQEPETNLRPARKLNATGEPPPGMRPPGRFAGGSRPPSRKFRDPRFTGPAGRGNHPPERDQRESPPSARTRNSAAPATQPFRGTRPPVRPLRDSRSAEQPDRRARPPARSFRDQRSTEPPTRSARGPRGPERENPLSAETRNARSPAGSQFRGPRPPLQAGRGGRPPIANGGNQRAPFRKQDRTEGTEQRSRGARTFGESARAGGPPARNFRSPASNDSSFRNTRPPGHAGTKPPARNSRPNTMKGRKPEHE